jgi:hypothetical protein
MVLQVGDLAPDLKLTSATGETQGEFQLSASKVYELGQQPDLAEILDALKKLP